jgi:hypothetical protein
VRNPGGGRRDADGVLVAGRSAGTVLLSGQPTPAVRRVALTASDHAGPEGRTARRAWGVRERRVEDPPGNATRISRAVAANAGTSSAPTS